MKNTLLKLAALIVLISVFKDALAADTASGSSVLPYETWLKTIQKSLTGPVAFSLSCDGNDTACRSKHLNVIFI